MTKPKKSFVKQLSFTISHPKLPQMVIYVFIHRNAKLFLRHSVRFPLGDYNGDGQVDIITGDNNDDIAWHKSISTSSLTYERAIVGGVAPAFSFANGDFDNDGDTDIIVTNGEFWWYENQIEQEPNSVLDFMEKRINVFPNPFQDQVNIGILGPENYHIKLHSTTGELLFSQKLNSPSIDLSFLSKGIYILSLENSSTKETHSTQLVKIK